MISAQPEGMRTYPIARQIYGDPLGSDGDFNAEFRIGFGKTGNALYVAIGVDDDSIVRAFPGSAIYDAQDGCEIYIGTGTQSSDTAPDQYAFWGDYRLHFVRGANVEMEGVQVEAKWTAGGYQFEWRIDISAGGNSDDLATMVGFDIALWDRDEDGTRSFVAWAPGALGGRKGGHL